jgi:hypothetical protein
MAPAHLIDEYCLLINAVWISLLHQSDQGGQAESGRAWRILSHRHLIQPESMLGNTQD